MSLSCILFIPSQYCDFGGNRNTIDLFLTAHRQNGKDSCNAFATYRLKCYGKEMHYHLNDFSRDMQYSKVRSSDTQTRHKSHKENDAAI